MLTSDVLVNVYQPPLQVGREELWFIAFANFYGINTLTMAIFKLSMVLQPAHKIPDNLTMALRSTLLQYTTEGWLSQMPSLTLSESAGLWQGG